jgi:hypothetical protein
MLVGGVFDFLIWGWLGAVAHVIVMKVWNEKTYLYREFGLASIVAILVYSMNLPNSLTAFGIAFLGVDALEGFLRRVVGRNG